MGIQRSSNWVYWVLVILLLVVDQASKIYVKTHFFLGEEVIVIPDWFRLSFTENQGVAFGLEYGGAAGKYVLSVFRIIFSGVIAFMLYRAIRLGEHRGIILAGVLILAGAIGNVIDGIFYGSVFTASSYHLSNIATFVPFGQGYSSLLQGKVVDFFYFPFFHCILPDWLPYYGGQPFSFFNAIFNVADSCITVGLGLFLIFMRKAS